MISPTADRDRERIRHLQHRRTLSTDRRPQQPEDRRALRDYRRRRAALRDRDAEDGWPA
ncbi:MAG: hypothetical protein ABFE07_24545 [Armatimonadia bacterium]